MSDGVLLWRDVQHLTDLAITHFRLKSRFRALRAETSIKPRGAPRDDCGGCYTDGIIEIRIHRSGRPNKPLSAGFIHRTLAHELAHLKYWRHGRKHLDLARRIKEYWREIT